MILPGATLGLLGGGQLGRMFVFAARSMGYRVIVLDPEADCPAAQVADRHLAAAYDDEHAMELLARECAAVTTEFENVPAASLEYLAARVPVRPGANAVAIAQDRALEKTFLREHGLATARFAIVDDAEAIASALREVGAPALLKTTRLGYDGKGQARVDDLDSAQRAFAALGGVRCVLEERVALQREISVVLGRGADGEVRCYPVTENWHRDGILDISLAPARVAEETRTHAMSMATAIAAKLDYCGVLAVEFFVSSDGRLLVNEFAPRPHNSGHWTLDAAITSQFEQQVRALCGLPLGDTRVFGGAAMLNLLGDLWHGAQASAWENILRQPGAKLHLYGKQEARVGRKMGHVTCLGETPELALESALRLKGELGIS
ncbi:5-(carboxyamino)imidazole ribonucleotide synthase [Propionivibrio sp.]|uniref:5-(carboxyamino)imidazole ribonucleotide synthase n=1 Tax=Propionivibrio sp. TaxID=2212460 RepID=UPI00272E6874|nr:5-(carboxyamino)imidazole ribonucleotide synthase [Propionivibrio sp.]